MSCTLVALRFVLISRVFRDAGKFEAGHKAAGLDLHYQVECGKGADHTAASKETFAALMKFLDSDDHEHVREFCYKPMDTLKTFAGVHGAWKSGAPLVVPKAAANALRSSFVGDASNRT